MHSFKLLLKIGAWFAVVSAVICLVISLFAFLHARSFTRSATRAQGTVVRLETRESRDSGMVYHPVVTFQDAHGATQELYSSVGSFPPSHRVGDTVTVLYRAEEPRKAKLDGFFYVWGLAAITAGIGSFWLIAGLAIFSVPVIIRRVSRARRAPGTPPVLAR
jgi:hypothetical protein